MALCLPAILGVTTLLLPGTAGVRDAGVVQARIVFLQRQLAAGLLLRGPAAHGARDLQCLCLRGMGAEVAAPRAGTAGTAPTVVGFRLQVGLPLYGLVGLCQTGDVGLR